MVVWKLDFGTDGWFFVFGTRKEAIEYAKDEGLTQCPKGTSIYDLDDNDCVISKHYSVYHGA